MAACANEAEARSVEASARKHRTALLAFGVLVVGMLASKRAQACSCSARSRIVYPSSDGDWPETAPLLASGDEAPLLADEYGQPLALATILTRQPLGLCPRPLVLYKPETPLVAGAYYSVTPREHYVGREPAGPRILRATSRPRKTRRGTLAVTAAFEDIEPWISSDATCADPKLDGRLLSGILTVVVESDAPVALIATLRTKDAELGVLENAAASFRLWQSWEEDPPTEVITPDTRVWVDLPRGEGIGDCATLQIHDADARKLVEEAFCFDDARELSSLYEDVKLTDPSEPETPEQRARSGSCSMASSATGSAPFCASVLFAPLWLRRRRYGARARTAYGA